jgi:hypothetical protein
MLEAISVVLEEQENDVNVPPTNVQLLFSPRKFPRASSAPSLHMICENQNGGVAPPRDAEQFPKSNSQRVIPKE